MTNFINMNNGFFLVIMIFLHVVADFNMQSSMVNMKEKKYWENQGEKNKFDYVMPLIGHAFQWSFMVHVPIMLYCIVTNSLEELCYFSIVINSFIHAGIDTLKANDKKINLIQDQWLHMLQIIATWAIFCWSK